MSTSPSTGSPINRRGIFIGQDCCSSKENIGNPTTNEPQINNDRDTPNEGTFQSDLVTTQNHPNRPPPAPPRRFAAVSELPRANNQLNGTPDSTIIARISPRGYTKPLPKLMLTIRAGATADTNGNESPQPPPSSNQNTLRNAKLVAPEAKFPAVPPRSVPPKQQPNGGSGATPPKRAVSVGPKSLTLQPRTPPTVPPVSAQRPTSTTVRKNSREPKVPPRPRKGAEQATELKRPQEQPPSLPSIREPPSPRTPTVPKGPPNFTSPTSNVNRPGVSKTPLNQNTNGDGSRKTSSEHRRVSTYHTPSGGVVRKTSKDQTNLTHLRAPSGAANGLPLARNTSKDYAQNQAGRTGTNQAAPAQAKRASREADFKPGHRRVPSSQSVSVPSVPARKLSRDTIAVAPTTAKRPPSFNKTTPGTPTKQEQSSATLQTNGVSASPQQRSPKLSVVPKLALGRVIAVQSEITSDPNRELVPVSPKPAAPKTARDRTNKTQFLDDVVLESKPKPMFSTFMGSNGGDSGSPKKPVPPARSATVSTQGAVKARIGASPKKAMIGVSRQEPKPLPAKLRKRTFSVSKKKSKKIVLTSVSSNNTQERLTTVSHNGLLISHQNFTNSVTITTISNNDSTVMDNLSMLLGWEVYHSQLYCLYANGSIVVNDLVEKRAMIRLYIPAMRPALGTRDEGEQKRIQNCVLMATERHLLAVINFVSDGHHTFICWEAARLGSKPDVFELALKYDNKPFYPLHTFSSMDGNIMALSSGETVLVFLYNMDSTPKQLCELNIKGGSIFKAWQLDVSVDANMKPIQVGGHVIDSVLIFGDIEGKVSVLDTFGRQLCSGTLPRQSSNEPNSPKLLSPRGASPVTRKLTTSLKINCFHIVRGTRMFFAGHEDGTVSLWLLDQEEGSCTLSPLKAYQVHGAIQGMCIDYKGPNNPGSHLLISIRKSANEPPSVLYLELPSFLREIVQSNL